MPMYTVSLNRKKYSEDLYRKYRQEDLSSEEFYLHDWIDSQIQKTGPYLWCTEYTVGDWNFRVMNSSLFQLHLDMFEFNFELEEDAMAFKLRWGE